MCLLYCYGFTLLPFHLPNSNNKDVIPVSASIQSPYIPACLLQSMRRPDGPNQNPLALVEVSSRKARDCASLVILARMVYE